MSASSTCALEAEPSALLAKFGVLFFLIGEKDPNASVDDVADARGHFAGDLP